MHDGNSRHFISNSGLFSPNAEHQVIDRSRPVFIYGHAEQVQVNNKFLKSNQSGVLSLFLFHWGL